MLNIGDYNMNSMSTVKKSNGFFDILEEIGNILSTTNIRVRRGAPVRESAEMLLPSTVSLWDEQIMINVHDIREIRTVNDYDYFIEMIMNDGREISIKYTFRSRMHTDLEKIMNLREVRSDIRRRYHRGSFRMVF